CNSWLSFLYRPTSHRRFSLKLTKLFYVPHVLRPLPISLADPLATHPDLELAITGRYSLLPLPAGDRTKSTLLKNSQRAGEEIESDIALVVPTSGSTGTPKGAQLTAHHLISSADATYQRGGGLRHWLLAMPAHHIAGLQVLSPSMVAGVEPLALHVSAGLNITAFARATRELTGTMLRCHFGRRGCHASPALGPRCHAGNQYRDYVWFLRNRRRLRIRRDCLAGHSHTR